MGISIIKILKCILKFLWLKFKNLNFKNQSKSKCENLNLNFKNQTMKFKELKFWKSKKWKFKNWKCEIWNLSNLEIKFQSQSMEISKGWCSQTGNTHYVSAALNESIRQHIYRSCFCCLEEVTERGESPHVEWWSEKCSWAEGSG